MAHSDPWPALPLKEWQPTYDAVHLWMQIVGKVRLSLAHPQNHWWHVALHVNSRGLTTSPVPCGWGMFEIQFDFLTHELEIHTSDGTGRRLPLREEPVSAFYARAMEALKALEIAVTIDPKPQEMADTTPFDQDHRPREYDRDAMNRCWRILASTADALDEFRGRFTGKCSPVNFFWGSFDLACSRFSGRKAPPRKGVISGPAYSHEVISAGFWPGGSGIDCPAFYAYAAPVPEGLPEERVGPAAAGWDSRLGEFLLMYDDVRGSREPRGALMEFLETTYAAAAKRAGWDRSALES
jgi:Family of unknown function (DUF5996)